MLQEGKRRREKLKISGEGVLELSLRRCARIGQEHHWRKRCFRERDQRVLRPGSAQLFLETLGCWCG